jgi:hypothetical protein
MGLEAACTLAWQGRKVAGKALLETEEILFRGPVRLKIPKTDITAFAVDGDALRVTFGGETASFGLGPAAEKWARALATKKTRIDKLGIKEGQVVSVVGVDDPSFGEELRERIGAFHDGRPAKKNDVLMLGVNRPADLDRIEKAKAMLEARGALWIIRPKGRAEVTEAQVRAAAKGAGLVDVKVAAFSATHTAEKYVIPVAARGGADRKTRGR